MKLWNSVFMRGNFLIGKMRTNKQTRGNIVFDVDKPPSRPIEWIPWPAPKGTIEERIAAFRKKHPKMSYDEAHTYLIMEACGEVSAVYLSSDGGGRFGNYARRLRKEGKM